MKTYEAMFLLDAGTPDFESAIQPVRDLLTRINAEVISLRPWDERRLAYEIRGRKRALYVLVYFKADPLTIASLQHDILINEKILRAMVFSADDVTAEEMNAPTPAQGGRRPEGELPTPGLAPAAAPAATAVAEAVPQAPEAPAAPAEEAPGSQA